MRVYSQLIKTIKVSGGGFIVTLRIAAQKWKATYKCLMIESQIQNDPKGSLIVLFDDIWVEINVYG